MLVAEDISGDWILGAEREESDHKDSRYITISHGEIYIHIYIYIYMVEKGDLGIIS